MLVFFLIVVLFLAGCGQREPAQKSEIRICGSSWYGHAPVWAGMEKGIFKKAGLNVSFSSFTSSTDRMAAVTTDSCQFASLGEVAMLSFMAQGNKDFYWVGNQDIAPGFEGIVAKKEIKTIKDLKGKKVAIQMASSVDLTVYDVLSQHGLDAYKDIRRVPMQASDMFIALSKGFVDAAAIWEPTFSKLQQIDGMHVLAKDTDTTIYKKYKTMTGPDVLVMSRVFVDRKPEVARKLLKAYFQAVEWVKKNPDETVQIAKAFTNQPQEVLEKAFRKIIWRSYAEQKKILSDQGMFPQVEEVIAFLYEKARKIPRKPDYKKWVRADLYESQKLN